MKSPPVYVTRLQKGGALIEDMRLLVRSWRDSSDGDGFSPTDALAKGTKARLKDTMIRAFQPRFLNGDPAQAWKLVRPLEDLDADAEVLHPIYYWITARAERVLYDFVAEELRMIAMSGDGTVRIEETVAWLRSKLVAHGREPWTPTVTTKVARGMLAALRDFGILEGATRKKVAAMHLPMESFSWIAFCLSKLGASGEALVQHPDWKLFLLTPTLVENLFLQSHQRGFLGYHAAGRIHRVEFSETNYEKYAHVLLGR